MLVKKLTLIQILTVLAFLIFLLFMLAHPTFAQLDFSNRNTPDVPPRLKDLEVIFQNIIRVISILAGLTLLFMFIAGGFKFLTSEGDPKALDAAKGTLTYAIIGLAGIISAYFIIQIISGITGLRLLDFCIPSPGFPPCP